MTMKRGTWDRKKSQRCITAKAPNRYPQPLSMQKTPSFGIGPGAYRDCASLIAARREYSNKDDG